MVRYVFKREGMIDFLGLYGRNRLKQQIEAKRDFEVGVEEEKISLLVDQEYRFVVEGMLEYGF